MMLMRKDVGADKMITTTQRGEEKKEKRQRKDIYIICVLSLECKVRSEN